MIGVFNEFREHKLDRYAIAEYAFEAERLELGVSGGWQDQYSTVFGGFNFLQFNREHNVVTPLRIEKDALNELEECFVLCHTDSEHLGAGIQDDNLNKTRSDNTVGERLKNITDEMKRVLLKGEYKQFSMLLDETWQLKKENNSAVSNAKLDNIYNIAIKAGATAGRLLGTGGGGYFLFFTPPFCRYRVIEALQEQRLNAEAVLFDHSGLSSWKSLK